MKVSYIKIALSLALVSLGMTSCLKDKAFEDQKIQGTNPEQTYKVIEMAISVTNSRNFKALTYAKGNADTTVNLIPVHLATPDVASEDLNVTLAVKPELVQAYNTAHATAYVVPSSSLVSIVTPNNVVTIPKGSNTGYLQVKFNPTNLIGGKWALGFAITSVDKAGYNISGNLGSGVVSIGIK